MVAIVGWDVADRLFGAIEPVDKELTINGVKTPKLGIGGGVPK